MLKEIFGKYPESIKRIIDIVRSNVILTIEDYEILTSQKFEENYNALTIYIEIKELFEDLKLARLAELITSKSGLEELVIIAKFGNNNDLARFLIKRSLEK